MAASVVAPSTTTGTVTAADTTTEPSSTYTVSGLPASVVAGAATDIAVTVRNNAPAQNDEHSSLYIATLSLTFSGSPSVTGVSATQGSTSVSSGGGNTVVTVSTADVAPQASVSIRLALTVPFSAGSTINVTTNVTPSSSETDGDGDDTFAPATQVFPISVQPSYTLAFSTDPPAMAQESQPFCPEVAVQLEQGGSPVTVAGIPVQITGIAASAAGTLPVLSGTTTTSTNSQGVALFGSCSNGLQIDNLGTFALKAVSSSPLVHGTASSSSVQILQSYIQCNGSCSITVTSTETGVSSTIKATGNGHLGASFGQGLTLGCDSQVNQGGPWDPLFIGGSAGISGTVTMTFPKEIVNTQSNSGRPHMQVCAQAGVDFQNLGGTPTTDGLVPDCVDGTYPPGTAGMLQLCVLSRVKGNLGHETVTLLVSDLGDPSFW